jgi:hypothetical protein
MAEQVLGPIKVRKLHCSIEKHAKKRNSSSKFSTLADMFYINGGSSSGQPVANKDLSIHWLEIPAIHRNTFVHGTKTSKEWTDLFIDILTRQTTLSRLTRRQRRPLLHLTMTALPTNKGAVNQR